MKEKEHRGALKEGNARLLVAFLETAGIYQQRIDEALKEIGLSPTLYVTLEQLADAGAPLTQRELAAGQQCAASNITQKIDRLEKEGLVRRLPDPSDRRSILAELTPLGADRAAAGALIMERMNTAFVGALDDTERKALVGILERLRAGGERV